MLRIDESELIRRLVKGDNKAFDLLFENHYATIFRIAYRILNNREDAEEIAQSVFVELWEDRESLTSVHSSLKGWLISKSRTTTLMFLRNMRKETEVAAKHLWLLLDESVESAALHEERWSLVQSAIEQLPDQQRKIYTLHKVEKLRHKQIAAQLGVSVSWVKQAVAASDKRVRQILAKDIGLAILIMALQAERITPESVLTGIIS